MLRRMELYPTVPACTMTIHPFLPIIMPEGRSTLVSVSHNLTDLGGGTLGLEKWMLAFSC